MPASFIIVIEDNADFAAILETVLRLWGYSVQSYATLAAGTAVLARTRPALLILDGQLPDGDGYSLYLQLRRVDATRELPVLLLSVSDDVYQRARTASYSDPYLHVGLKPMPLDEIQTIVMRIVQL